MEQNTIGFHSGQLRLYEFECSNINRSRMYIWCKQKMRKHDKHEQHVLPKDIHIFSAEKHYVVNVILIGELKGSESNL